MNVKTQVEDELTIQLQKKTNDIDQKVNNNKFSISKGLIIS